MISTISHIWIAVAFPVAIFMFGVQMGMWYALSKQADDDLKAAKREAEQAKKDTEQAMSEYDKTLAELDEIFLKYTGHSFTPEQDASDETP